MPVRRVSLFALLLLVLLACSFGQVLAQTDDTDQTLHYKGKVTPAEWKAAAERFKAAREAMEANGNVSGLAVTYQVGANGYYIPDFYATPNWAFSPPLTKFLDPLPNVWDPRSGSPEPAKCIPIAVPDTLTYPGSDYYEIELVQYREQLHSNLPPVTGVWPNQAGGTLLRGYRQINLGTNAGGTANTVVPGGSHYLGPLILATKSRPVRIKFINSLPTGTAGNLQVPVDPTIMGSGPFEINYNPDTMAPTAPVVGTFPQNRATLHLHGGRTPWISDGTPHQWIAPAGETPTYNKGVSVEYVPDMWFTPAGATIPGCAGSLVCATPGATNNPGSGAQTFFWTNDQSGRLMFYHDHAWGITRLNVYVGEAAGYLITDSMENALVNGGQPVPGGRTYLPNTIPGTAGVDMFPLVIQDKTFVDATTIGATDPTWAWGSNPAKPVSVPQTGDLWWPHVYMPAQNPFNPDTSGINAFGRWHYGPWFFPPTPTCGSTPQAVPPFCIANGPIVNPYYDATCVPSSTNFCQPPETPGAANPSWGAEAFLDTMMVNGEAYPKFDLPTAGKYRFRILNASHDRFLNLQLYRATPIVSSITLDCTACVGYNDDVAVTITPAPGDPGRGATAEAVLDGTGKIAAIDMKTVGSGYLVAPTVTVDGGPGASGAVATANLWTQLTEVGMVPAVATPGFPTKWPTDGRDGGVPDPATRGPAFIQIGTEGGLLPKPSLIRNQPVNWNVDPTMFNYGNVLPQRDGGGAVILGPAERADVIVDFTNFAGQTLILYNDAPTAFPALDPHYDYYTGAPDRQDMGAAPPIPPGVGPNVRTVMQINVPGVAGPTPPPVDDYVPAYLTTLQTAFASDATTAGVFAASQEPIPVGQTAYNSTYNTAFPAVWPDWGISRISDGAISFVSPVLDPATKLLTATTPQPSFAMKPKALHDEMGATFDDYGRMSAKLGLEMPFTNAAIANFILQNYVDPPTEVVAGDQVQIWRITHNGVDTHPIHFHLFDVQVLNRVGWDGFIRLPDDNELGWKDTVRTSPLEDTIVALRPIVPPTPFPVPTSIRPLNPAVPLGSLDGFSQIDQTNGGALNPPQVNELFNFGSEYVWHCHILSHEENDMMRSIALATTPSVPTGVVAGSLGSSILVTWTQNPANASGFRIQRARDAAFTLSVVTFPDTVGATASFLDTSASLGTQYYYRVAAINAIGPIGGAPLTIPLVSAWSAASAPLTLVGRVTASAPAVAWNSTDSQFQIALRLSTNKIVVGTAKANGVFNNDWLQLATGATGDAPAIAWNPSTQKVQIAVKASVGSDVYLATYNANGSGLSAWTTITSTALSSPGIAWNPTAGKLQLVIRGTSNRLFVGTVNGNGTGFSGWTQLATGRTPFAPAVAWNPVGSKVQMAVKSNADNTIWVDNMNSNGTGLGTWVNLAPGGTGVAPAITWNSVSNNLEIAVKSTVGNTIYKGLYNADGSGFSGFTQILGTSSTMSPAVAINPSTGAVHLFSRDSAGNLSEYITVP